MRLVTPLLGVFGLAQVSSVSVSYAFIKSNGSFRCEYFVFIYGLEAIKQASCKVNFHTMTPKFVDSAVDIKIAFTSKNYVTLFSSHNWLEF